MSSGTQAIIVGAIANLFLSIFKLAGGILGNSVALVADVIHSLTDLLTDAIVFFTHQIGKLSQDENHPYGHARAETIGSALIGLIIVATGIGVINGTAFTESSGKTPGLLPRLSLYFLF